MFAFEGYTPVELIHEGDATIIYRCDRSADHTRVVLKSHRSDFPTALELAKLRHEHALLRDLQGPGILAVGGLVASGPRLALVLEDVGAPSLDRLLGARLDLGLALRITIAALAVLKRAHQRQIVHKDIKPQNILVQVEPLRVHLIDWGISSRLNERHANDDGAPLPNEGTLAYIAPEQTGLTDQLIDARTDLYSLGVTLYELLTGALPFTSEDPGTLLRSHLAELPNPPHRVDVRIPAQVSDIAMKLLAKSPEDRYASARGLEIDLVECLTQWEGSRRIEPFALGRSDASSEFRIPQKLYGRDAEGATLMAAFQRAARGAAELTLVTGYSGVGKSAIVHEACRPMRLGGAHVVAGKFEQYHGAIPYVSLAQAFRELIRQTMAEGAASVARWRERLLKALGQNAGVLVPLVPEIERLLGPQPPVPEIGPTQAEARFHFVVQQFVSVFADPAHPLVLFLDDLQWAEPASLKLLEKIITDPETRHLLIIGAYRDNDPDAIQRLTRMLDGVAQARMISRIELRPLLPEDVRRLVADTLSMPVTRVAELADEVHAKTQGNAFYVAQLLTSLAREGQIAFAADRAEWEWDLPAIAQQAVAENVADFVAQRLRHLDGSTQRLLKLAACLGAQFEHDTLAALAERSLAACARELWDALVEGVVVPLHDDYRLLRELEDTPRAEADHDRPTPATRVAYRFVHDRVREAAYSLLEEQERPSVHLHAARLLRARHGGEVADDDVFTVADHVNIARTVLHDRAERIVAAELDLRAGRRAKASAAYSAARDYLTAGLAYLPEDAQDTVHALDFALRLEHAETVFLCGDHAEADALFDLLLARAGATMLEVRVQILRIELYNSVSRWRDATQVGRAALTALGVPLPEGEETYQSAFDAELANVKARLRGRKFADLVSAPPMTDPGIKAVMKILLLLDGPSFQASALLSAVVSLRQARLSLEYGPSELSACAYAAYGLTALRLFGKSEDADRMSQLSSAYQDRYPNPELAAKVSSLHAGIAGSIKPLREAARYYERAAHFCLQYGDMSVLAQCIFGEMIMRTAADEEIESVHTWADSVSTTMERTRNEPLGDAHRMMRQLASGLRGMTTHPWSLSDGRFDEKAYEARTRSAGRGFNLGIFWCAKIILLSLNEGYESAIPLVEEAPVRLQAALQQTLVGHTSFHLCLLLCALLDRAAPADADVKQRYEKSLAEHHATLTQRRALCAENWRCHDLLIAAERARLAGREEEALQAYDQSIELAQQDGFVRVFALGNELCGKLHLKRGRKKVATFYLTDAYQGWLRWGAWVKADALAALFPECATQRGPAEGLRARRSTTGGTSTAILQGVLFDLGEAMRAGYSISSEIAGERVIERFLRASCASAAAQRAFVVLKHDDDLLIAGRLTTNPETLRTSPVTSLTGSTELAASVVRYVANSHEAVSLGSSDPADRFLDDPYIREHRPKSLLCLPLIHQGHLVGVWYAESSAVAGLRRGSIELLQMLATQAASALANARLYEQLQAATQELSTTNERLEADVVLRTEELRRETRQLRATQARLVKLEKEATEVRMAGGFAHEMRNALAAAKLFLTRAYSEDGDKVTSLCHDNADKLTSILQLSREHLPDDALQSATGFIRDVYANETGLVTVLKGVSKMIDRSLRVTDQILDYSRMGFEQPGRARIVLKDVIDSVVRDVEARSAEQRISIVVEASSDRVVRGDEHHFYSILNNLVSNACDALLDMNGRERVLWIRVMSQEDGGFVLQVADNGPGIAPEHRARLFEPFFSTKPNTGTGLGLGFVDKTVSLYGGTIDIESEVGQGTTVSIRLPRLAP